MSGSLIPNGKQQYFDANGTPLAGGKVYYYIPYTTTAKNTWQDINLSILNTNPIILDAAGECIAWGAGAYRQQVYDVNNNLIWDQYTYGISPTGSNFISQEEVQTATQGQTQFSLTTITYTPGINSLVVFVNGSKQLVNVNYTETSSVVVTFTSGLNAGDVVDFYASLPASAQNMSNAVTVAYDPPFTNSVATNVQAKLAQYVSVKDFGADPTGTTSSLTAFQNAVNASKYVYVPSGTYKLDSQLVINNSNTTILLASNVTLKISGTVAQQGPPFGNSINVLADNCALIGSGPSSLLQMTGGSQANAVGLYTYSNLLIRDLTIDGGKASVTSFSDDTFGSGIALISNTGTGTTDIVATIENVTIKNFYHYGINIYGNLANGIKINNCTIHDNGVTADANSTGGGIAITNAVSNITVTNNTLYNNKWCGLFASSAGNNGSNYVISNNIIYSNGATEPSQGSGIYIVEDTPYASVANKGLSNFTLTGNISNSNGRAGITFTCSVGFLKYITLTGNTCISNTYYGIEVSNANSVNSVISNVIVGNNNCSLNGSAQTTIGQYVTSVEGSPVAFTPTIYGTTSSGTGTYTQQQGNYTKINNIVYFSILIQWSGHTGTGNIGIGNLPLTADNINPQVICYAITSSLSITGQTYIVVQNNTTNALLFQQNNGSSSSVAMASAGLIQVEGFYRTTL